MNENALTLLLRVFDGNRKAFAGNRSGIALLATGLAVERCLIDDYRNGFAFRSRWNLRTVTDKRSDHAFSDFSFIAKEFGRTDLILDTKPNGFSCSFARTGPVGACFGLLTFHGDLETVGIDSHTTLTQRILREIEREAVSVVELESSLTIKTITFNELFGSIRKQAKAAFKRLAKTSFFKLEGFGDQRFSADQFRIGLTHFTDERWQQTPHQWFFCTEQLRMAHSTAHDAAQYITATFIRRQNAVGNQEA